MNENLDLTKILEGCPEGTEFYHIGYGRVNLVNIYLDSYYPIRLAVRNDPCANMALTKKGTMNLRYEGECVLFPSKDQRDWSKFKRFWDKTEIKKFNPKTFQPFDKVLGRCGYNNWCIDFFAYKREKCCVCVGGGYYHCIPYNEETKHLIGTSDDCPEYYKWWEE